MRKKYLGEFEELVLLTVAVLSGEGYGAAITLDIVERTSRDVQISAVHVALMRLETKGLVSSRMGCATRERGGRRKRLFLITTSGISVLENIRNLREQLWNLIVNPV